MAIMKCKMCGGDLNVVEGVTVTECDYCGTKQTVPSADNEKKTALFTRANKLRMSCDFDKAAGVYESIVTEFSDEAEAYWGLVLCKYGIEYVDDPLTGKKIPTCHRSSFESVMDDGNFELVMENADALSISVYREEAKQIEELRKGIIEVSSKEEPYDIFICYKETAENGDRTLDSLIAQDVYNELTAKGYRVFFSRITLETTLGKEYEPYIFAALNSAKIMLAFGTCYEHYNAVWVKNEWSRFLQLIAAGEKKTLIPCYKGIDAYDMPKEFTKLQAQDMGKVGAIQDLVRGIEKILPKNTQPERVIVQNAAPQSATTETLLKRAFMFLEDGKFESADEYCEKVLDIEPTCSKAYLGKLMINLRVKREENLKNQANSFSGNEYYKKALRFADSELESKLKGYISFIDDRNESQRKDNIYNEASRIMRDAKTAPNLIRAAEKFESIKGWKESDTFAAQCREKADTLIKDEIYNQAVTDFNSGRSNRIRLAEDDFKKIAGWRDADELLVQCPEKLEKAIVDEEYEKNSTTLRLAKQALQNGKAVSLLTNHISALQEIPDFEDAKAVLEQLKAKKDRLMAEETERQRKVALDAKRRRTKRKVLKITKITSIVTLIAAVIFSIYFFCYAQPSKNYKKAVTYMEKGEYDKAYKTFKKAWSFKDSYKKRKEIIRTNHHLAKKGDIIELGAYEQDNNVENGSEPIEWEVLKVEKDKILAISTKTLYYDRYSATNSGKPTWGASPLRSWLNNTFLTAAFTPEEQAKILETENTTATGQDNNIETTKDRLFIFSQGEAKKYDVSDASDPTAYADANYPSQPSEWKTYCWTRTPANSSQVYYTRSGSIYYDGAPAGYLGVRPMVWIDISKTK